MMLPNQINSQRFSTVGKGGYRASEVDAFMQKISQNYNKLFNDNNVLKERLASITPLIEEYNENKKAIANALIWAQTTSDKTISDAKSEAKKLIDTANAEGESLIAAKTAEAESAYAEKLEEARLSLEKAAKEYELIKNESVALSEKYISEVNAKANEIIEDANAKASKIVADAYNDAKTAREKSDSILKSAKAELDTIKKEATKLKREIEAAMNLTVQALSSIEIGDFEAQSDEADKLEALTINKADIEEFAIDFAAEIAEVPEETVVRDEEEINSGIQVETVVDEVFDEKDISDADLISGVANEEMLDVNAYISKIFESVGSNDSDFTSFADGLNDILEKSFEDNEMNFDELKKSIGKDEDTVE